MDSIITKLKIVLGSQSPRRKELLKGLDVEFQIRVADIVEDFPDDMPVSKVAEYIADKKLIALQQTAEQDELIICCDTVVVLDNEILGKPDGKKHARTMLQKLSGRTHTVISGVAMGDANKKIVFSDQTHVKFKTLSDAEIDYYLNHYEPYDKAGSYGVQEWIGMIGILNMQGSYFTVMGFPIHLIYQELKNW